VAIRHDARIIPLSEMQKRTEDVLAACLASSSGENPPRKYHWRRSPRLRLNHYAKIGAVVSLAASLDFAYTGRRRLHIVTGWIFVACLCSHMAVFRRALAR
jgi:hypothetical protein